MQVTIYSRPNGRQTVTEIKNVRDTDAEFFENNGVDVGMEDLGEGMGIALYGRYAEPTEDRNHEPLVIALEEESCEEALRRLRDEIVSEMRIFGYKIVENTKK